MTVVIISIGLFGMMVLYHNTTREVMKGDLDLMATYLVRERLEQLISDKVSRGYAYVKNENYTTSSPVSAGTSLFTRSFNIYEVRKDDLITPLDGSGFKRIDMTVSWGATAADRVVISTLVTSY